jgi:hypothetical protein
MGASSGVAVLTCSVEGSDDAIATWSAATELRVLADVLPAAYRSERINAGTVAWTFSKGPNLTQPVLIGGAARGSRGGHRDDDTSMTKRRLLAVWAVTALVAACASTRAYRARNSLPVGEPAVVGGGPC